MKLQGRNLSIEMQGEDVRLIPSELKLHDPFIGDNELNDTFFGESTQESFIKFWKAFENHVESLDDRDSSTTPIRIQGELIE
jgi:hypothetical protein